MKKLFSKIIKAGLLAGTLDILSAFTYYFIKTGKTDFESIFKFIASGIFGKDAFSGGNPMIFAGFILHYVIAFIFTIFFFWLFPKIKFFSINKIITAIVYGIFAWIVMNLGVLPLSNIPYRPFNVLNAIINIIILIVCIGLPLSFIANAFYKKADK